MKPIDRGCRVRGGGRARAWIFLLCAVAGCAGEVSESRRDAPTAPPQQTVVEEPTLGPTQLDRPLFAWSFEPASADCNGWPVLGAEAIRASPSRTGSYSCKVCANGSTPDLGLTRELGAVPPGRYAIEAWVRKRAATAAPGEAHLRLEADTADGTMQAVSQPVIGVREEWDRLEAIVELGRGASQVRVVIGSPEAAADRCLFVDDVTLTRR